MNERPLSEETVKQLDRMVERVARKAGYTGHEELTYAEFIQNKVRASLDKLRNEANHYRRKLSLRPSNRDFAEEIKTYLRDGLRELMDEGHSEQEALEITLAKFDQAELNEQFADFLQAFDHFGLSSDYQANAWAYWATPENEAIGLFYGAFLIIGGTFGGLLGYLRHLPLIDILIGAGIGCLFGIGGGLLCHAIITLRRKP